MRQKTTITYLEHNMLACNRINRAIASWKKHVRVLHESRTCLSRILPLKTRAHIKIYKKLHLNGAVNEKAVDGRSYN